MKPIPSLLVGLMLICVALVSYDGGKRQARREAIDANFNAGRLKVKEAANEVDVFATGVATWPIQGVAANMAEVLIVSNVFVDFSEPRRLVANTHKTNEVILRLAEWAYTETVWTNKDGYNRSVITSDGGTVIRTNPVAPTDNDELVRLRRQIEMERQKELKATFEAGFYAGRLTMTRHIKTNGVSWPYELSMQLINASTNELKAVWDEFNRE